MTQGGLFDDERVGWVDAGRCARCGCTLWRTNHDALISKITQSRRCGRGGHHEVKT
jgi:hypothetical protein